MTHQEIILSDYHNENVWAACNHERHEVIEMVAENVGLDCGTVAQVILDKFPEARV